MEAVGDTPLVSIVMINWNRKDILKQVLTKLASQTYARHEIVIADNGSTDGAPDMVEKEFPQVKLMRLNANLGIKGYNIAFENSHGQYIVILDNDSFLEDEGIAKIIRKFEKYPNLGALGCKVYNYYSGNIHHWHPTVKEVDGPEEGFHSPLFNGCAAAAKRSVLEEVGFYPEEFFLYENERDLCTRIINAGHDVRYFTDIEGFHMVSEEGRSSERQVFYGTRNFIWYLWKYMPVWIALKKMMLVIAWNTFEALKGRNLRMYLKPIAAALTGLPGILKNRTPIKKEYIKKTLY